jgi:glycosyltransferase involved in cell wall biosynthesis
MTRPPVSAFIATHNEEARIGRCLESVKWCDEIVVVDDNSTDRTKEICRRYTENIFNRKWDGYASQKGFAMQQTTNDWVLLMDSDEELSPALINEIQTELENLPDGVCGYEIPRKVFYLGRWMNHSGWYPDYKLRLYRKSRGYMGGEDPHEVFVLDGGRKRLRNDILHYSYKDISEQVATLNRYSDIFSEFKQWSITDVFRMLLRPPIKFLEMYIAKAGILDGLQGFAAASMMSYFVFIRYAKMFEKRYGNRNSTYGSD